MTKPAPDPNTAPPRVSLKPCAITPAQERLWSETRAALVYECPAFTHILYSMLDTVGQKQVALFTDDPQIPVAATDGASLILNPEGFFKYNLKQRTFIVAHEILHCILNHCVLMHQFRMRGKVSYPDGKTLPYVHEVMNIAMDLVINDILMESKNNAGKAIFEFPPGGCHDPSIATAEDSALDAYRKLYEDAKGKGKGKGAGQGQGFDILLDPGSSQGKDPVTASQQRNESEWTTQVAAAMSLAKASGKLPGGLQRLFEEVLSPQVDWKERIKALFARKVGSGSYDWRKADRRLIVRDIYAPARSGFGAGDVVVGVDTSGSIGPKELDMFFAEMSGILDDVKPRRLFVVWCDAQVHRVDELEEAGDLHTIRCKGAPGGGGTSFIPVFEKIDELGIQPDALVYLTDGMGSFPPAAPSYPVIWGNIYPSSKYPFGDVVDVPKQA